MSKVRTDNPTLFRDTNTGALINSDVSGFALYKERREQARAQTQLKKELDELQGRYERLETLVESLLDSNG